MTNLIKVSETINAEKMTSLQIAEITGKQHAHVMEAIRAMEPAWEKVSQSKFRLAEYLDLQKKLRPCYELSKSECLYIATKFNDEARAKLIIRWEQLEIEKHQQFKIPQTLSQALMLAAKQAEVIEKQQLQLTEQAPKVEFFDAVADSKDAISMNDAAKVLNIKGMGRNNLFEFLRDKKVLMQSNRPYQRYVDCGYFRVIETRYTKNYEECISFKTLIYQRGLEYVRNLIIKEKEAKKLTN